MANSTYYDFHCPAGGKWYACTSGAKFVGCCTEDPCSSKGCAQGNIQPARFNASHHGEFPDATCDTASDFYSCTAGDTFWGCCKSDACKATPPATCASGNLTPALLGTENLINEYTSASPTSSASSTPATSSKSNTGAIVGGVVGGVLGLALIGVLIFFLLRKKRRNQSTTNMSTAAMVPMTNEKNPGTPGTQFSGRSPPPTYTAPIQDFYQNISPKEGHQSYHQYASAADEPQELPAEHRYSELPAEVVRCSANRRISELPAGATQASELESPQVTPKPSQAEFSTDMARRTNQSQGLGVTIGESSRKP